MSVDIRSSEEKFAVKKQVKPKKLTWYEKRGFKKGDVCTWVALGIGTLIQAGCGVWGVLYVSDKENEAKLYIAEKEMDVSKKEQLTEARWQEVAAIENRAVMKNNILKSTDVTMTNIRFLIKNEQDFSCKNDAHIGNKYNFAHDRDKLWAELIVDARSTKQYFGENEFQKVLKFSHTLKDSDICNQNSFTNRDSLQKLQIDALDSMQMVIDKDFKQAFLLKTGEAE